MRRRSIFAAPLLLLVLALTAVAQTRPSTIPVSEIHRGMHGYGLTVFEGETPARFDVEVIDVLHDFRPDQDLILVHTSHPILDHAAVVGLADDMRVARQRLVSLRLSIDPCPAV